MAFLTPLFWIAAQVVRTAGRLAGLSRRSRNARSKLPATALLATALCALPALADTKTWTGAVDPFWSNAGNWTGGAPAAGDRLVFPVGAANPAMRNDYAVGTTFYDITWYGTGYTIIGNAFGLNGIANSGTNTIGVDLTLTGGSVSGGSLTLAGNVNSTSTTATFASVGGSVTQSSGSMTTGAVTGSVTLSGGGLSASSVGRSADHDRRRR